MSWPEWGAEEEGAEEEGAEEDEGTDFSEDGWDEDPDEWYDAQDDAVPGPPDI